MSYNSVTDFFYSINFLMLMTMTG